MKKIYCLSLLFVFLFNSCSDTEAADPINVTGKITNNYEYNGGANPPQEILDALAVYSPSSKKTFYIRNANNYAPFTPILASFSTDTNGIYTIAMPAGSYAVISQEKYDFEQNPMATADCNYLLEPDFIMTVVSTNPTSNYLYTAKANYCIPKP
ncbi:hypothetical protein [Flavobacterium phycosphaerae]|uniref:hypothetical protein n=1 Tax=Flavobacterium phycosphaerae TaxID=2697515 RepID=UPI001389A00C|nr:hypothetical protein [Flavobacterium phycosphaerae]